MVTSAQENEIRKRMRRIKDAKDEGDGEEVIKERTRELYRYLEQEGLTLPDE